MSAGTLFTLFFPPHPLTAPPSNLCCAGAAGAGHGSFDCEDCVPDTVNGAAFIRDLYEKAKDTTGGCVLCVRARGAAA